MKTILKLSFALIVIASFSCKKANNPSAANNYPMQVKMTDAAGPYDAVYIDVKEVDVITDNDTGWQPLNTNTRIYDLTRLVNGKDTLLASGSLASSNVTQIRLILGTRNSVVVNGQSYPLKTPSAQESGLKLNVHYTMKAGVTFVVMLDFDANRSIVKEGNGDYLLKPVIHSTATVVSGAIKGVVSPANSRPLIYAVSGSDSIGALSDAFGNFMFSGLNSGTYTVVFIPALPLSVKIVNNVNVSVAKVTDMGTVTLN